MMPKKRTVRGRRGGLRKRPGLREKETDIKNPEKEDETNNDVIVLDTEEESCKEKPDNPINVIDKELTDVEISVSEKDIENIDIGKVVQSTDGEEVVGNNVNKNEDSKTSICDNSEISQTNIELEDNVAGNKNTADADFVNEVEEAFIDKELDEDIQYIDEEVIEDKDQELCVVLEGQQADSLKNRKDDNEQNKEMKIDLKSTLEEEKKDFAEDNNFEEISDGSMDPLEQSGIIEAISDNEIVIENLEHDKDKDNNDEAADSLEQVFLATENESTDKVLVEDKDNDDISDTSLCGVDDKNNLSLEEISDEELDSSKKKHIHLTKGNRKGNEQEQEQDSGHVKDSDGNAKKRQHLDIDKDKIEVPSKKVKLVSDLVEKPTTKQDEYEEAAFFTNISSFPVKPKEGGTSTPLDSSDIKYVQQNTILKEPSPCQKFNVSTQTQPLSRKGKIVQCNISPIFPKAHGETSAGKEGFVSSKLFDKYKDKLPASISDIFHEVTSTSASEQGYYQFSMGPVTHADIDSVEFRNISLKFVEKFKLCFNSRHHGVFTAQLHKQEAVASLIRRLKQLKLGTRYMIFSIVYRSGLEREEDSIWKASIVYMYSEDSQIERQAVVRDGKERARLSVEGVPKAISKDFIQMLFPESLYISSRLGASMDRCLTLGYSSYLLVEETTACYEMVLINGLKISMFPMDPVKDISSKGQTDPEYIDDNGVVLIQDSQVNMTEEDTKVKPVNSDEKVANELMELEKDQPSKVIDDSIGLSTTDGVNTETMNDQNTKTEESLILNPVPVEATDLITVSKNDDCTSDVLQDKEKTETISDAAVSDQKVEGGSIVGKKDLSGTESDLLLPAPETPTSPENILKDFDGGLTEDLSPKSRPNETTESSNDEQLPGKELFLDAPDQSGMEKNKEELLSNVTDNEAVSNLAVTESDSKADPETLDSGTTITEVCEQKELADESKGEAQPVKEEEEEKEMVKESGIEKGANAETDKCGKDNTSLEDVSDDEIINADAKPVSGTADDDVIILQEDTSKRVVAEIDLTKDSEEPRHDSSHNAKVKTEESKKKADEKLSLTDGNLQVTMEVIDVEEEDEPERVLYAKSVPSYSKDHYQTNKNKDRDSRRFSHYLHPGSRLVTRGGEIYIPKTHSKEWSPGYDYFKNESAKNYEQVSSIRSGSSLADVYIYEGSSASRLQKAKPSIREKSLERHDNYRREYRRSKSPSPRHDIGFERKIPQQRPRQSEHFQHSRPMYSKDYSQGYSYGNSASNQGRGYSEWHSEHPDSKRRDLYPSSGDISKIPHRHSRSPPYKGQKNWKEGGLQRSPTRFRRTLSRSLSPLSDKSFSSSSYSSRNRKSRTKRPKVSFVKRISRSPISISSRSPSLSPVSKSPSPQRYNRSSLYKSRRDQYSPQDRSKNSRTYTGQKRSRSRSPYWSKTKAKSRSPPYKKGERSPPYKRVALSPVTNRERAPDKHVTTSSAKSAHTSWPSQNEKSRTTTSYDAPTGSAKPNEIKSSTYGNYQQQGPPPNYGFPMASVNYSAPPQFPQWPASAFPPSSSYAPQQAPVYNNPSVVPPYNYGGMPSYPNVNPYSSYPSYSIPTTGNDPNQVPHPNYNPYIATAPQGTPQSTSANNVTGGPSKKPGQPSQSESSSSKKWSMGGGGGALVFQRILSNVPRSKK